MWARFALLWIALFLCLTRANTVPEAFQHPTIKEHDLTHADIPSDGPRGVGKSGVVATLIMRQARQADYQKHIIDRNIAVRDHLFKPIPDSPIANITIDVVLFHEGDVSQADQNHIQAGTPDMPLTFVDVSAVFKLYKPVNHPQCPNSYLTKFTEPGYHSMCYFWFIGFQRYVERYDWLLRIDTDCLLCDNVRPALASMPSQFHIAAPRWIDLDRHGGYDNIAGPSKQGMVVQGMHNFTVSFAQKHGIFDYVHSWHAPYTNVMLLDLIWYRNSSVLRAFTQAVDASECIYSNRWGDMPLWGAAVILEKQPYHRLYKMSYFHGSHRTMVH